MPSPSIAQPDPVGTAKRVEHVQWFNAEVRPHDGQLKAFLRGAFPSVRDVDDVVQESYLRIWQAKAAQPIQSARAFLFTIAKRLAIDAIRKEKRTLSREVVMDSRALSVVEDRPDLVEAVSLRQEIGLLAEAIHALPARCREVMILRKLHQLSHQEIAKRLGIAIPTVEVQISRGMEKCTQFMRSRAVVISPRKDAR